MTMKTKIINLIDYLEGVVFNAKNFAKSIIIVFAVLGLAATIAICMGALWHVFTLVVSIVIISICILELKRESKRQITYRIEKL